MYLAPATIFIVVIAIFVFWKKLRFFVLCNFHIFSNVRLAHKLPELPYDYAALEPVISRDIMNLHHCKHHQTYVTNLNAAEEKLRAALEKGDAR